MTRWNFSPTALPPSTPRPCPAGGTANTTPSPTTPHAAVQTLFNVSPTEAQLSSASEP
ncbi:MAG: hypothetical protein ACLVJH_10565 [Faecalibacterium prausnitzii]